MLLSVHPGVCGSVWPEGWESLGAKRPPSHSMNPHTLGHVFPLSCIRRI